MAVKDVPQPGDVSREFWAATSRREFLLQHDAKADRRQFFPRPVSLFSESELQWRAAAGTGTLSAVTTARSPAPGSEAPHMVGLVKLDEGPRVFARLLNAEPNIAPGRRMRLTWEQERDGLRLYAFEPA